MTKTLISGARIIDGSGSPAFPGSVLIVNDRIQAVSRTSLAVDDAQEVDAAGLVLAPGFIDVHAHSDLSILAEPEAIGKISQGITSELSGNCGLSAFPIRTAEVREHLEKLYRTYGVALTWSDFSSYADVVTAARPAINVGFLCGHNTLRANVFGYENTPGTSAGWERERDLLTEMLEQGALGFSTGLLYTPGKFAPPEELRIVASALRGFDAPYATHLRSEGDALIESLEEALAIARAGSGRLQVSHLKTAKPRNWHKLDAALSLIESARREGLRVTADRYPYTFAQTSLSVVLPPPYDGMTDAKIQETLSGSPEETERLTEELVRMNLRWETVLLCSTRVSGMMQHAGCSFAELSENLRMPPERICMDLLRKDSVGTMAAFGGLSPENLRRILSQEWVCCGTDETARPVSGRIGRCHPRGFGSFPRFLNLCRAAGIPLETAVARMTSLPASIFHLSGRGRIAPGCFADLILFSETEFRDCADFTSPHALSAGLNAVYVNGKLAFSGGNVLNRAGRVLKGTPQSSR